MTATWDDLVATWDDLRLDWAGALTHPIDAVSLGDLQRKWLVRAPLDKWNTDPVQR